MYLDGAVLVRTRAHGALRVKGSLELETALREFGCEVEWLNGARREPTAAAVAPLTAAI
jgi:hypothetical protein